ncbi:MAG TPA: hypothetical protein VF070_42920 [Streptosporangiaceae bacterium]
MIGDMAELLNDTRPAMFLGGVIVAALSLGIAVVTAFTPGVPGSGTAAIVADVLLSCLILCWLRSVALLTTAARPILGMLSDHRWKSGAPLNPRARWLTLPPIQASPEEWTWVRAHLLLGAARLRMERTQAALTWAFITTTLFAVWTAIVFLSH